MSILPQAPWTITWVLGPRLKRFLILHFREVTLWRKRTLHSSQSCLVPAGAALTHGPSVSTERSLKSFGMKEALSGPISNRWLGTLVQQDLWGQPRSH